MLPFYFRKSISKTEYRISKKIRCRLCFLHPHILDENFVVNHILEEKTLVRLHCKNTQFLNRIKYQPIMSQVRTDTCNPSTYKNWRGDHPKSKTAWADDEFKASKGHMDPVSRYQSHRMWSRTSLVQDWEEAGGSVSSMSA